MHANINSESLQRSRKPILGTKGSRIARFLNHWGRRVPQKINHRADRMPTADTSPVLSHKCSTGKQQCIQCAAPLAELLGLCQPQRRSHRHSHLISFDPCSVAGRQFLQLLKPPVRIYDHDTFVHHHFIRQGGSGREPQFN